LGWCLQYGAKQEEGKKKSFHGVRLKDEANK
jgi:hypothetical protein